MHFWDILHEKRISWSSENVFAEENKYTLFTKLVLERNMQNELDFIMIFHHPRDFYFFPGSVWSLQNETNVKRLKLK